MVRRLELLLYPERCNKVKAAPLTVEGVTNIKVGVAAVAVMGEVWGF